MIFKNDYIDREAAKIAFQNMDAGSRVPSTLLTPEEFAEYLDEIPAADVAPVKHGHWIEFQGGFFTKHMRCSVCLDPNGVNAGRGDMNYCPNCGADMRGE